MRNTINNIIDWLQKQAKNAHANGLLVGVSGGLDSAVVAYLIKHAFPDHSAGVIMPIQSNKNDIKHAHIVIEDSKLKEISIDLSEVHREMYDQIKKPLLKVGEYDESKALLADANLRARLRMSTLYTIATNYNYLVVGTDNASEWYTGYFTKYGDGGVDLLPIVDFTKQEVREMGQVLGVPDEIINKVPSADLWEGQTDEKEMGTTYDIIDAFIRGDKIPEEDLKIIEQMHERTNHKRHIPAQYKRK